MASTYVVSMHEIELVLSNLVNIQANSINKVVVYIIFKSFLLNF